MNMYVLKVNTQNGERIGISQEPEDGEVLVEITGDNMQEANKEAEYFATRFDVPMFNNDEDVLM